MKRRKSRSPSSSPSVSANHSDATQQISPQVARLHAVAEKAETAGRILDALRAYDEIIGLNAATADTWHRTADLLLKVREYAQAIPAFQHALQLDPSRFSAHHNLARAYYTLGDADRAVSHLRTAIQLSDSAEHLQALATVIPNAPRATHEEILVARRNWATHLATTRPARPAPARPVRPERKAADPIRVAYLSAHFAGRNYMKPVWALINHHDRDSFDITLLSDSPRTTEWAGYRPHERDRVLEVSPLSDDALAETLEAHQIDLLIDLSAYSHPSRMSLFTHKLAPITIAWFNMYATSGFPGIDFLIADPHVVRPEEEAYYTESIVRLPLSYLTFEVDYPVPDVGPLPALRIQRFTFGSLVSLYKITPPVLDAWAEILKACPECQLLLANSDLKSPHNRQYILDQFTTRGVHEHQLRFLPPADHDSFLRYYEQIDLALDAFPYSGGTTTMEALWQGVPVLTLAGDRWAARTSETLLRECHFEPFVAQDVPNYVQQAQLWATQPQLWPELDALRMNMRAKLINSSVCDGQRLAHEMEAIYRRILSLNP